MPKKKIVFDPHLVNKANLYDIVPILAARHPRLSAKQHEKRIATAVHEAAHLIAALYVKDGYTGPYAYIKIPGRRTKNPMGSGGIDGVVACGAHSSYAEAYICGASLFAELVMQSPDSETAIQQDSTSFDYYLNRHIANYCPDADPGETAFGIIDDCLSLFGKQWDLVEKTAFAMLLYADSSGDLTGEAWAKLRVYIKSVLSKPERGVGHTHYTMPRGVSRRLHELNNIHLGEIPGGLANFAFGDGVAKSAGTSTSQVELDAVVERVTP